jgi:hypothetical protein
LQIGKITLPLALPSDLWLRVLEQFLLLMLIVRRWLLPKHKISHDRPFDFYNSSEKKILKIQFSNQQFQNHSIQIFKL